MKFISIAHPKPSEGIGFDPKTSLVIPDQSLTLEQILERFTRGEQLTVGKPTYYDDLDEEQEGYDYEKIRQMDMIDKAELLQSLKERNSALSSPTISHLDNNSRTDTTENEK